jgi:hypothetical protein
MRLVLLALLSITCLSDSAVGQPVWWKPTSNAQCPSISPGPATYQQLGELPLVRPDPDTESAIRSVLSLYPFAVDGKNFEIFDRIFTQDVRTNYSAPINVLVGLDQVKAVIAQGLDNFAATHHSYGTQYIANCGRGSAISVTYFTASHYFHPSQPAEVQNITAVLWATGRYEDTWQRQQDGGWKISNRNLVYTGPLITGY